MLLDTTRAQLSAFPAQLSVLTVIHVQTLSAAPSVLRVMRTPSAEHAQWATTNPHHSVSLAQVSLQIAFNALAQPPAPSAPWDSQAQLALLAMLDILDNFVILAFQDTIQIVESASLAVLSARTVCNVLMRLLVWFALLVLQSLIVQFVI